MKYRIVHNGEKVIECVEHSLNTVTSTPNENNFIIDTLDNAVEQLTGKGIDISFLWKNGIIDRITPENVEVDISDHPTEANVKRKVFIHSMPVLQNKKAFWLNIIVRHFDLNGNHIPETQDDEWFSTYVDNSTQVDGQGEFDYFRALVDAGTSIFYLQSAQIPTMDNNGRFGESLYG